MLAVNCYTDSWVCLTFVITNTSNFFFFVLRTVQRKNVLSGLNVNRLNVRCLKQLTLLRLWSHCIRIWPVFYTDIHGRHRQNKQMHLGRWRRSQWRRAALALKFLIKIIIIKVCYISQKECLCRRTFMLQRAVHLEKYIS